MQVGCIYHHNAFYADRDSGELLGKYLLILALPAGGDVVFRVLTSRHADLRPPGCHHGAPYPGFALGVPGGELAKPTWVDLREQDDYDLEVFRGRTTKGLIRPVRQLNDTLLRAVLECAAGADDTTPRQERHMRDAMAALGS
ncbi:hypothetical protein [Pseudomarimonas arenosa]|uniref:PemK-like, MazF-like toxin of type II toxin-antitoxin system n=1 Tax=Pseudomarimonas arenosa TaxID=2774145 RepID=A0AAW3ZNW7_9GAMM|nr:hypothetical protein [Pseudomarimonas arenosa]MBD8527835.1 hypothetical protein [Pseudomarimonas arenosa]